MKSRDEMYNDVIRPYLQSGEILKCAAYGIDEPLGSMTGSLKSRGMAGNLMSQMVMKHYYVGLTNRRVIVVGANGFISAIPPVEYLLGKVGGAVIASTGLIHIHIEIQHAQFPFKAKFSRMESTDNRASALMIAEALKCG